MIIGFSSFGALYGVYSYISATNAGSYYAPEIDLEGKTYIVTGANSGIGNQLSTELAARKARVIMACRNRDACVNARRDIVLFTRNKQVYCRKLDLADFDSVRDFATKLYQGKTAVDRIDGIIHNAATLENDRDVNKNGIEKMLATNYMGSFLLTGLLLDKLLEEQKDHRVKIIFMNTDIIKKCKLDFDDLNAENKIRKGLFKNHFDEHYTYKMSKLAQATFAKELSERLKGTNISVLVTDPGKTATNLHTKLSMNNFFLSRWIMKLYGVFLTRMPEKAVKPVMYSLIDPETYDIKGSWVDWDRKILEEWPNSQLEEKETRARLWATSEAWTHFKEHYNKLRQDLNLPSADFNTISESSQAKSKSWLGLW
uniref:Uncharacterized protein n=1 Tax=Acrobeloides nanus TaxID=290746 RepID=A0A914BUH3_9BILA